MMNDILKKYIDVLYKIDFTGEITSETFDSIIYCALSDAGLNFELRSGATKGVILPDEDHSFVIKLPFTGITDYCDAYDEDLDEYFTKSVNINFECCPYKEGWDYAGLEASIYQKATVEGFEDIFAKTELLGYFDGYPIYISERVTPLAYATERKMESVLSEEERNSISNNKKINFCKTPYSWIAAAIKYFGEEMIEKVSNFLEEFGVNEDMHSNNIGFLGEKPVILDYSGFFGLLRG